MFLNFFASGHMALRRLSPWCSPPSASWQMQPPLRRQVTVMFSDLVGSTVLLKMGLISPLSPM
jgi:hypothetical protein